MKRIVQAICIAAAISVNAVSMAYDYNTTDAKVGVDKSQLKAMVAEEKYYLERVKQDLDVFEKDHVLANLGTIYLKRKDYPKALKYLGMVGHSFAQNKQSTVVSAASYNLGMIYIHGKGTPKNFPKAFEAFTRATWGHNVEASREVYVMCRDKEVGVKTMRAFTQENLNYFNQGESHPLYETATLNLQMLYACDGEREYLDGVFGEG